MNFMQWTCVALWQHSEKDIFFFFCPGATWSPVLNKEVCFVGSTHEVNGVHLWRVGGLYLSSQRAKLYWHSLWKFTDSTVFLRKRLLWWFANRGRLADTEFRRTLQSRTTFLWSASRLGPHLCCFHRGLWGWCILQYTRKTRKGAAHHLLTVACWACRQRAFCLLKRSETGHGHRSRNTHTRWKKGLFPARLRWAPDLLFFLVPHTLNLLSAMSMLQTHPQMGLSAVTFPRFKEPSYDPGLLLREAKTPFLVCIKFAANDQFRCSFSLRNKNKPWL